MGSNHMLRYIIWWCPSTPVMGKLAAMNVIYRIFIPILFYYGIYLSKIPRSD
jgi:hypothetical protein